MLSYYCCLCSNGLNFNQKKKILEKSLTNFSHCIDITLGSTILSYRLSKSLNDWEIKSIGWKNGDCLSELDRNDSGIYESSIIRI